MYGYGCSFIILEETTIYVIVKDRPGRLAGPINRSPRQTRERRKKRSGKKRKMTGTTKSIFEPRHLYQFEERKNPTHVQFTYLYLAAMFR
jgi:hypothetical protein